MGQRLFYFYFGSGNAYVYNKGNLAVHFVDVGHGDCTIIQLPDGKVAVIDGGSEYYWNRINKYIRTRIKPSKGKIDYVFNTHPDHDHTDGLVHIQNEYHVGEYIDYKNFADHTNIIEPQYRIKITSYHDYVKGAPLPTDKNILSPIITLEYSAQVFVITGDAFGITEREFITTDTAKEIWGDKEDPDRRANQIKTYLKVSHHGSQTAGNTSTDFLDFIKPSVAVISVGTLYNLPDPLVVKRLREDYGIKTYITRDNGNIAIRCNGDNIKVFLAFNNPPDLTGIWVTIFAATVALCFINYKKHNI